MVISQPSVVLEKSNISETEKKFLEKFPPDSSIMVTKFHSKNGKGDAIDGRGYAGFLSSPIRVGKTVDIEFLNGESGHLSRVKKLYFRDSIRVIETENSYYEIESYADVETSEGMNYDEMIEKMRSDLTFLPRIKDVQRMHEEDQNKFDEFWDEFKKISNNSSPEFWNYEYIEELANHLKEKIEYYEDKYGEKPLIVEVGAGNGRLTYFLNKFLKTDNQVIATSPAGSNYSYNDSIKGHIPDFQHVADIDLSGVISATKGSQPIILIWSWMPRYDDFTEEIRSAEHIKEYILIGGSSFSGKSEESYGEVDLEDMDAYFDSNKDEIAKEKERRLKIALTYQAEGFSREELEKVEQNQICEYDLPYYSLSGRPAYTGTYSFTRDI